MHGKLVTPPAAPRVAAYCVQAINKADPHPAAPRLWEEYLYSAEGQNTWLAGYARPVLQDVMIKNGTIDQAALGKLAPASGTPVVLTQDQISNANDYLKANWTITIQ